MKSISMSVQELIRTEDYQAFCRGGMADPYPFYQLLRETDPVHWSPVLKAWVLTRYVDVAAVSKNPKQFSSDRFPVFMAQLPSESRDELAPLGHHMSKQMVFTDPPDHTRLRGLLQKGFTPRALDRMRPRIQELVDELLERQESHRQIDLIADFAYPLPATVISEMLGVPPERRENFKQWGTDILAFMGSGRAVVDLARPAKHSLEKMHLLLGGIADERRREPREDIISALLQVADESEQQITHDEFLATCVIFLSAGHETTTDLIGNGTLALLKNPDQLALLRSNYTLIESTVEEVLRYDPPTQRLWRVATEDVEIDDQLIRKGDVVLSMIGAANRDPEQFAEPDQFDITRRNIKHLAFGQGLHFCLGAPLARMEGQIAIRTLATRFPDLRLSEQNLSYHENMAHRRLHSLSVKLGV